MSQMTIIGLGLIGTSLGLALKKAKVPHLEVVGFDLNRNHAMKAKKIGAIDKFHGTLPQAVRDANLIVLATPIMATRELMEALGSLLGDGVTVTDTGSTKRLVLEWASEHLSQHVDFVGGHPMGGKPGSGPSAADPNLFVDTAYALCPSLNASQEAVQTVAAMVERIGATPYYVDPSEHDSYIAAINHLPIFLSTALVNCTNESVGWREMAKLATWAYRDVSSLASGDPIVHRDICTTNRENIVYWLEEYTRQLSKLRDTLQSGDETLEKAFINAWEARARWVNGIVTSNAGDQNPGLPKASEATMTLFLGEKLTGRLRQPDEKTESDPTKYRKV